MPLVHHVTEYYRNKIVNIFSTINGTQSVIFKPAYIAFIGEHKPLQFRYINRTAIE